MRIDHLNHLISDCLCNIETPENIRHILETTPTLNDVENVSKGQVREQLAAMLDIEETK
ncbi:MAG: hypothetical protein JRF56_19655 [Deltaproteobacteria bacterium]|jgi:hypothetical protein|nr:hypothetical protein [Deltaproteobacteria bacterium]